MDRSREASTFPFPFLAVGTADAEIKALSVENPELTAVLPLMP